jgi:signal transduction histidine kinase
MALEQQGANAASALQAANAKLSKSLRREQETVRESRELDQAKTDFISTVSHELRTPLTSTTGYLEVLCDDAVIDEMGKHAVTGIDRCPCCR